MPEGDPRILEARVERVVFANEDTGWAVVEVSLDSGERKTAVGELGAVVEGDELRLTAQEETHPRFGPRLKVVSAQPVSPRTLKGIELYLTGPRVEGVGPELARRLVAAFGTKTLEILDETPERVSEVPGIGPKRAAKIAETWVAERERRELRIYLAGHGIGAGLGARIEAALGDRALATLRRDPYGVIGRVEGFGFRRADALAGAQGMAEDAPARLAAGLRFTLDRAREQGNLALPGARLVAEATELLRVPEARVREALRGLTAGGELVIARPEGAPDYLAYSAESWALERRAAERLVELLDSADPLSFRLPSGLHLDAARELSPEQVEAVTLALREKVAVITGGPGVGKTTVLRTLVRIWRDRRLEVALTCPTGRAAKRLEEVSGLEASTIHRFLKFEGARFVHGREQPVRADVVVVDETSMLELPLFVQLLEALPLGARLLLVGDADQLPSVGPGQVLRDLISSGRVPVARLTRIFRQASGSRIVAFAHELLRGEALDLDDARTGELVFIPVEDPEEGAEVAARLLVEELPGRDGLEGPDAVQILTPTQRGPTGAVALNQRVQERIRRGRDRVEVGDARFQLGDRVMQVRNDYDRALFNGDVGRVTEVDAANRALTVRFDGEDHRYRGAALSDLRPAWAITVHKSQGGEYPAVILPLFAHHYMLLARPVLYTAVTRARSRLVILGQRSALERAIARNDAGRRHSSLAAWLAGTAAEIWRPRDSGAPGDIPPDSGPVDGSVDGESASDG
ncbi:MAG: ATP-dependent RecD-like DNA helicase [Planctomycetota bacterium]